MNLCTNLQVQHVQPGNSVIANVTAPASEMLVAPATEGQRALRKRNFLDRSHGLHFSYPEPRKGR